MAIKTITVDGTSYPIGVDVANIEGTLPLSKGGTGATTAAAARTSLGLGTAATHAHGDYALASHTHDYSKVTVTQTQTSGQEVGKITVDGTTTTLYAPEGGATSDTQVTQTVTTANNGYPILASAIANGTSTTTSTSVFNKDISIHPSRKAIYIKGSGVNSGFHITNANGIPQASLHNSIEASSSTVGLSTLQMGGTNDDNTITSAGEIYLFNGNASVHSELSFTSSATSNRTHQLPNANGYLAVGSTAGVGSAATPVYMNSSGVLTACSGWDTNTDTKVTQTVTTSNSVYPVLLTNTASKTASSTDTARFSANAYVNASYSQFISKGPASSNSATAGGFRVISQNTGNNYAALTGSAEGTTSTTGQGRLTLGNSIAEGTAGNASGNILFHGTGTAYASILCSVTTTNRTYHIPDAGGSADFVMTAGAQTIAGAKTFSGTTSLSSNIILNSNYGYTTGAVSTWANGSTGQLKFQLV